MSKGKSKGQPWRQKNLTVLAGRPRCDNFLALHFTALSLADLRGLIERGEVRVNGRVTLHHDWVLRPGDQVSISLPPDEAALIFSPATPGPEVLFADEDLLIVNKPPKILSHPSPEKRSGTLLDNATQYVWQHGGLERPHLLHRLDRETSGALAFGLNEKATQKLNLAFQERRVPKFYQALVHGVVAADAGEIDAPIGSAPKAWPHWRVSATGAAAVTKFTVEQRFAAHTLLALEPLTGRTHQLRIHCLHLGHPLVGDKVYRGAVRTPAPRQMLHARRLIVPHPSRPQAVEVTAPYPPDFAQTLAQLAAT